MSIVCGCKSENKNSSAEESIREIDTTNNNIEMTPPKPDSSNDNTAIGNIHMNIDELQFESEKEEFLSKHQELGGLAIKSLKGFFYDNRLAAIEIISEQQNIHRKRMENDIYFEEGWFHLYNSKYLPADYNQRIHPFSLVNTAKGISNGLSLFKNHHFLIEVSDLCDSPQEHYSFEDIINSPKSECYGHNLLPLKLDESNNLARAGSVYSLIEELPKERAKYVLNSYKQEMNNINTDNFMTQIVAESAIDRKYFNLLLPEVQSQRNRLLNKHKNDPSWSFIIIYYKPLLDKYKQDQQILREKIKQEKDKELDII